MNKPRTFEHFPKHELCPVCHTNIDEECILIPIDGTERDGICQAKPVHLYCAVADRLNDKFGVIYKQIL